MFRRVRQESQRGQGLGEYAAIIAVVAVAVVVVLSYVGKTTQSAYNCVSAGLSGATCQVTEAGHVSPPTSDPETLTLTSQVIDGDDTQFSASDPLMSPSDKMIYVDWSASSLSAWPCPGNPCNWGVAVASFSEQLQWQALEVPVSAPLDGPWPTISYASNIVTIPGPVTIALTATPTTVDGEPGYYLDATVSGLAAPPVGEIDLYAASAPTVNLYASGVTFIGGRGNSLTYSISVADPIGTVFFAGLNQLGLDLLFTPPVFGD